METANLDLVYTVREAPENDELKYSLRSLKNIPHGKVFLYGGCPSWVNKGEVNHIPCIQDKGDKWRNTAFLLENICKNDEISKDFIWFNDDFFVMKKIIGLDCYKDRTLSQRINDFIPQRAWWRGVRGRYPARLRLAEQRLKMSGKNTNNFELHVPMVFNREKLLNIIRLYPDIGAKRSLYGNWYVQEPIQRDDVKIYTIGQKPTGDEDFISTSDKSFAYGEVGKYIRRKFRGKSPYELDARKNNSKIV